MRRLVWAFGWVGVALWSAVCGAAYLFFDVVGRAFMRNADAFATDPETVVSIFRGFSALHGLSTGAIAVVWAIVSLLILAVPWFLDRAIGSGSGVVVAGRVQRPAGFKGDPGGVIDLGPDQYRVDPRPAEAARAAGSAPRIPPGR